MKNFEIKNKSIILTVGPSGCGKSTLVKKWKEQLVEKYQYQDGRKLNVQVISTDDIRRDILGDKDLHRYDDRMTFASKQAFDFLKKKIELTMQYAVLADIIIVDSTGLYNDFRDDIVKLANKYFYNCYATIFSFKKRQEYFTFTEEENNFLTNTIINNHVNKFFRITLKEIKHKAYTDVFYIKHPGEESTITIKDFHSYDACVLPSHINNHYIDYYVIADIHECLDELKALLQKTGATIIDDKIIPAAEHIQYILLGDYIDKGGDTKGTIEFIHKNLDVLKIIYANHENYVYKRLKNQLKEISISDSIEKEYFTSLPVLQQSEELQKKFFEIVDVSQPFFIHKCFIATHAPCKDIYLGKLNNACLKEMRNQRSPRKSEYASEELYHKAFNEYFDYLYPSYEGLPIHVFGHLAFSSVFLHSNKLGIDTGAVTGNNLVAIKMGHRKPPRIHGGGIDVIKVSSKEYIKDSVINFFVQDQRKESEEKRIYVDEFQIRKTNKILEQKINFISGTISPTGAFKTDKKLEPLEWAFSYYKNKNINEIVLQRKYMGSRINLYLFKDVEQCYAVSRTGTLVAKDTMRTVFQDFLSNDKIQKAFETFDAKMLLLDGELLPWSILGQNMSEKQFHTVGLACQKEIDFLNQSNFDEQFSTIENLITNSDFIKKSQTIPKKELIKQFGDSKYKTYETFFKFHKEHISSLEQEKYNNTFLSEYHRFSGISEPYVKTFNILKVIKNNDSEIICTQEPINDNYTNFKMFNDDEICLIDLSKEEDVEIAKQFFDKTINYLMMEGVVVKPRFIINNNVAPFLKVRNERYLTITYGYDYLHPYKYQKLLERKRVDRKIKTSIEEANTAYEMLSTPYNNIHKNNQQYRQLVYKMLGEVEAEKKLDPRL